MRKDWTKNYLARINFKGALNVSFQCLSDLHYAHLMSVPFEDLDIHWGNPLSLSPEDLYHKVVKLRRGGFCYELNYLFANLLKALGFQVNLIAAQVHSDEGTLGDYYDHMTLRVNRVWLADVGFGGGSFLQPLSLNDRDAQQDDAGSYKIVSLEQGKYQLQSTHDIGQPLEPMYDFDLKSQDISNFQSQCHWKQIAADSHFVKNKICTLATSDGRNSLLNETLTVRRKDVKETFHIPDKETEMKILKKYFNITI